jgi:hypothetical protein
MNTAQPTEIEIHLNNDPTLAKQYGSQIKALGGRYSACRGYDETRFVHLPASASKLADKLLARFGRAKPVVIFRGGVVAPAWVTVQYARSMAQAEAGYNTRLDEAQRRGLIG